MKLRLVSIIAIIMMCLNASNAEEKSPVLHWEVLDGVLSEPVTVTEKLIDPHNLKASKSERYQIPKLSSDPHTIVELTLWESDVPGITIITKKHLKDRIKKRRPVEILSYLAINADAYTKYLHANRQLVPNILLLNPQRAQARYPNARYGAVDASGTGSLSQRLPEHGDDPKAYVFMKFTKGSIETIIFGEGTLEADLIGEKIDPKKQRENKTR